MSLRVVPTPSHSTQTQTSLSAPSAPGVHDTLRHNLIHQTSTQTPSSTSNPSPASSHPLESRLAAWKSTQETLKMSLLRRQYGIAEPVKRQMELSIVQQGEWRPAALGVGQGSAGVHSDILEGRDCEISWEDVYHGDVLAGAAAGGEGVFHGEMESRFGMGW